MWWEILGGLFEIAASVSTESERVTGADPAIPAWTEYAAAQGWRCVTPWQFERRVEGLCIVMRRTARTISVACVPMHPTAAEALRTSARELIAGTRARAVRAGNEVGLEWAGFEPDARVIDAMIATLSGACPSTGAYR